jgi:hypothetical protein
LIWKTRNRVSTTVGSLPFKKTSLTTSGQALVGSWPERLQTLTCETPAGSLQSAAGRLRVAYCIKACHRPVTMREFNLEGEVLFCPSQKTATR